MCDCFHLAFPNWHAASAGTGGGRRLRAPEPGTEDDSTCDEPSQFTETERPRPQGSSPVEEYPETEKYTDSDKECEAEFDPHPKTGSGKKTKKSGLGSMFEKRSTPKMSKLKEVHSPESGVIVKTAKDGCAEGLVYGGGGKEGIFIKEVVPESPASKSLKLKEGDQILSATVYFDNVSYEDAIQILEHAQAYKVKLCLKRKPDITETEPAMESDVIPEEDVCAPEMRDQGKTKRRGDARISWPKFPSFGKGRKSHFTRSHSSSEADEQRKLELSPTTSDTESPIKSQDALKGKKKHKLKLSALTKRGRISSSEDQDTDAHTSVQMLSPECIESPSGETPQVFMTEDLKVVEDLRREQDDQKLTEPQTVQHKVELITIDSTLKTEDLTVALAGQESPSTIKSPDGKKKKKERSELKMKILGKDKSHKKDGKAKSSPKRLKTLGASIEIADQLENEKSDVIPSFESNTKLLGDQLALDNNTQIISNESSKVISAIPATTQMEMSVPKVELEISDVALIQKSPQKGEEKTKKDIKQKQETKPGPTFKLPKIGFSDITTEETMPKMNANVEEHTTKVEQFTREGTEMKEDPYERLSKSSLSRAKLPKREDIEIPGMEDMSMRITAKGIKEPKAVFTGHYEDIQAETVQLSIDVDSVKEAVSKLPGFKLPKVDTSGVPIPEEITVIDANAQRISVKTPTKTKHEAHFSKFDATASPETSKTTVKLPKITPADITSEELLMVTQVDFQKHEKEYKTEPKQSDEVHKREHIIIPGKESAQEVTILQTQQTQDIEGIKSEYQSATTFKSKRAKITMPSFGVAKPDIRIPDIGIHLPKQNLSDEKDKNVKGERTIFLQEAEMSKTETKNKTEGVMSDVKIPEIDGIEYIDSADGSPAKKDGLDVVSLKADISFPEIRGEDVAGEEHTLKFGAATPNISINVPDAKKDINIDGTDIKTLEKEGKGGKFKIPNLGISMPKVKGPKIDLSLSKKDVDVTLTEAEADFPDIPDVDITLGNVDVSIPEQKMEVKKTELEIKPEGELDGQGSKFKKPKFGIKMPKLKGPEFDSSISKKDPDVTLPEAKAAVKLPEAPEIDVTLGTLDVSIPEQKMKVEKPELEIKSLRTEGELDVQEGKSTTLELGVKMPKTKEPEFDLNLSKKDVHITLPEAKAEVKLPVVEGPSIDVKAIGTDHEVKGSKFKMPHLGFSMPKVKGPQLNLSSSKKDVGVTLPETSAEVRLPEAPKIDVSLGKAEILIPEAKVEVKKTDVKIKPLQTDTELDGRGGKFQKPKFGITMPKIAGPEIHVDLSKKDGDVTLPEAKAEIKVPNTPKVDVSLGKGAISLPKGERNELEMKPLQSEGEIDGQERKFKMPKLGMSMPKVRGPEIQFGLSKKDGDMTLPEAKAELKVPEVDSKERSANVEIKASEIKVEGKGTEGSPSKFKMPVFKLPKFGVGTPNVSVEVPNVDKDVKIDGADINIPDEGSAIHIAASSIDIEGPSIEMKTTGTEQDGKGSKFKMPHLGFSMPKVKGPKMDLSLSKKDVDVKLPETKADVKLPKVDLGKVDVSTPEATMEFSKPEMEIQLLQTESELDGQGEKFKMPKFGIKMPKLKGPEFDLSSSKKDADVTLPQAKVEVKHPDAPKIDVSLGKAEAFIPEAKAELEIKPLQTEVEGQGSKFKMPKLGMSMPKVKGPEFHLGFSKKDVDVTLPEAKVDANLPDVELNKPSAKVEIKAPEIEVVPKDTEGSPSKFKMPNFNISMPKLKGPDINLSLSKKATDITLPGTKTEVKFPEAPKTDADVPDANVEIKALQTGTELEGHGGKFQMPKFGITMPKVKGPEIDLSFSKKDVDVTLPEVKTEVELLEAPKVAVDVKPRESEAEIDGQGTKFKMPKFGISMPKVKGPEVDFSFSKKDVDVTLPEAKAEVELPDVELKESSARVQIKSPEIEAQLGSVKGSPSKFKLPTLKFPKFGTATPNVSTEVPDIDKQIKMDGADMHISVPHKDVEVPEFKAEVLLPEVQVKKPLGSVVVEQQPGVEVDAKLKKPRFSLPRFSFSKPSVKAPEVDASLPDVNAEIPEAEVEVKGGKVDVKLQECEVDVEGQGSKFKMPKFGITMPKVTGPEIDLRLAKKDVLPEVKGEVQLPDVKIKQPSATAEIKAPEIEAQTGNVEGSPLKLKMPTFTLPKFGVATPKVSVEIPDVDKDIKTDGATVDVTAPSIDTEGLSVDVKAKGSELEGSGSKFKMPKFGISMPKVKGPEIYLSSSEKDADVTLPEATAEVTLPNVEVKEPEVEIKVPEIKVATNNTEDSPSKFKMPTFKLPKFGVGAPSATIEVPDRDVKIDGPDIKIPEEVLTVDIAAPSIDNEGPSIDIKSAGIEHEEKGSKFKLPSFGFSGPHIKRPDIDLSLSKKDVDVTLPEAKAEVKIPEAGLKDPSTEVEIKAPDIKIATKGTDGSPSKFKMPTFKLPKFGVGAPSATIEVPDRDVKIDGPDIKIPEEVLTVDIAAPSIDIEGPSIDIKSTGTEHEEKGSKFKLPSLGFSGPHIKQPDIDLSLSKKDVDVTLPDAKAEVKIPEAGLKDPSAEVEIQAPDIKIATKGTDGSPSKFKMPTFKLPKFGVGAPSATIEVPDRDIKIDGPDIKIPEEVLTVEIAASSIDIEGPAIDIKSTGIEHEEKGSKFKLPSFGFSGPHIKQPDIDLSLSKKDVDVTLPEAKAEVKIPEAGLKDPSAEVEMKAPDIKIATKGTDGSPSKFKMPTFKLPKFGIGTPSATIEVPDRDVKIDGGDIKIPEDVLAVDNAAPSIDIEGPSIDIKSTGTEHEGKGSKFKLPSLGFSGPQVKLPDADLSSSKKDVDVMLSEAKVKLSDVELKESSAKVEINAPGIHVQTGNIEASPSKLKMPAFKLPKFGAGTPQVSVEVPDVDKDIKVDGAELKLPETKAEVKLPDIKIKEPVGSISVSQAPMIEGDAKLKKTSWTLPRFSFAKTSVTAPEADVNLDVPKVDVALPEVKTDLPDIDKKESTGISIEVAPATDIDAKLKKPRFSLPKFSFSKQSSKESKVDIGLPDVNVSLPEGNVEVKQAEAELKPGDVELEGQESKFKMPKFGISMPKVKGPEIDLSLSTKDVDVTLPEVKGEVQLPDVKIKQPSATVEIKAPEIEAQMGNVEGSPSKLKMPTFTLPKFGAATPKVSVEVPDVDKDIKTDGATVDVTAPSIDTEGLSIDVKGKGSEVEGPGSKFKMPKFGISMPKVKGPEIDLSLSKKDVDVTLPEVKGEVQLSDVKIKQPSATVEIKAPKTDAQTADVEGSPSKLKMPTFTLPKFGAATPEVSVEVPDVDKDIKTDGATIDVTAPSIDTEGLSIDVKGKGSEVEASASKFKMPKFGISMPKVKGPEIDLRSSKKDVDVTLPEATAEVTLPNVEVKEPEGTISVPDAPTVEVETKSKRQNWTFPKFSFSRTSGKALDVDVNVETPKTDITSPEGKAEIQGPSGISLDEPPAVELEANLKKTKFSLPRFSFTKSSVKEPEVSAELPCVDVSLPEGEVIVKQPEMKIKAPEPEAEHDEQGSKFKLSKFGIALPKAKGPEENLNSSQRDVAIALPDVKAEVKLPETEVKEVSAYVEIKASETESKSKDVGGSPMKFKMPTLKMPKFGVASYDVTVEAPDAEKVDETDGAKLKEDVSVDIKTDLSKASLSDTDIPKTEADSVGLGSPSKFKLPSFKMPKLSFSRPNPEEEHVPVDTECKEDQLEMDVEPKGESKSPKATFTSFGEIIKNIDVEFDVPKTEQNLETSKEVQEIDESSGKQLEATKQDTAKSPERTGWFKFPKFGLSSPSEPAKITEKAEHKDEKSPVGETVDEEISPTCSVQSSDAFADISSAMTSEHVGLSLSSPTKVTVKYSDPNGATELGEMHSNIITSTTRTELISVEPNLPEKITILSSGVSSSSEDTLKLNSGKIHVITSNIQATPEAQHAKLLTALHIQSAGGLPLESETNEAASWTVEDSQSSKRTVFERHLVKETSSERSESKETIVITKQITRMFDSSEPISGETASSIQRLRDSVHTEKMRFFDGADK